MLERYLLVINKEFDHIVIGAGIVGISLGLAILERNPNKKVLIIDKEPEPGIHASGRNSGVLHAGFYYSPDSLKAKFCRLGNIELRKFCKANHLQILETGKVVVCRNKQDVTQLEKLYRKGVANGVNIEILDSKDLEKIEPAAQTVDKFIWSPTTAVGNPKEIINKLGEKFTKSGGDFSFNTQIELIEKNNEILVKAKNITYGAKTIINSAGAYAATLAKQVNVGTEYVCLPFLGTFIKSRLLLANPIRLIYPVPNPINPFLGVHTTSSLQNDIKIGPTAFPVIGKEQYKLTDGFNFKELVEFFVSSTALLKSDSVDLIGLAKEEALKLFKKPLLRQARKLSSSLDYNYDWVKHPSGIRAQIVNSKTRSIEMDYIVKIEKNAIHILNAVSPGWTSAIPFTRWVIEQNEAMF